MKNILNLFLGGFVLITSLNAQEEIYCKKFIHNLMNRVNEYQLTHPWKETDDNWIRGTYYTGVMAAYQATGEIKYLQQCNAWGEQLGWQIPGLNPGQKASGVNLLTCGQTWLESYLEQEQHYKIRHIQAHLEDSSIRNAVSEPMEWYFEGGRRYVDGLFTGPPALAMLYQITGEEKYLDWMDACFWDIYGQLFDLEERLFYRDVRYTPGYPGEINERWIRPDSIPYGEARRSYVYQKSPGGEKVIWSRGNGWALAGTARVLKYLPTEKVNYARYKTLFLTMSAELKKRQQPDGFWYPNLADPHDYGTPESSGTGFFIYGLAWGINNGILPRDEYLSVVRKAWAALVSVVSAEGKVQYGQLVGASPYKILQEDSHEYVSGIFLLAASEMYKMSE